MPMLGLKLEVGPLHLGIILGSLKWWYLRKLFALVIVTASKIIFWGRGFIATVQHSLPSAIIMLKSSQSGILNPKGLHTYVAEESVSAEMSSFHEVVAGKRCAEGQ